MKLLLDTRPFLWWLTEDPKLGSKARQAVADPAATAHIAAATLPRHHDDPSTGW